MNSFEIEDGVLKKYVGNNTNVTIPDGVTSIGAWAFQYRRRLMSVTIPDSVTSIGECAFSDCNSLMSVTIPDSVTNIGSNAFRKTPWLEAQTAGIICAGKVVIGYTGDETEIALPNNIKSIGECAFINCRDLKTVTIPESVTSIGPGAFEGCSKLVNVTILKGVTSIGECAFKDCRSLTSVTIPDSVTIIGRRAFDNCTSLQSVSIPEGVTSIESSTFSSCSNLKSVTIPNTVKSIGGWAFHLCDNLAIVKIPEGLTSIGESAFFGCHKLKNLKIPNSVTSIENQAFGYSGLTSITIPKNTTHIAYRAFDSCRGLKKINFEEGYIYRPVKLPGISASEIVDPKAFAYAILYQSGKVWDSAIAAYEQEHKSEIDSILMEIITILNANSKESVAKKAVEFALNNVSMVSADTFKQFYSVIYKKKFKCLKLMIEDTNAQTVLLDGGLMPEEKNTEIQKKHPIEKLVTDNWKYCEETKKLQKIITKGIPYVDSEELSSPEAVILVVFAYAIQVDDSITYYSMYKTSYVHSKPDPIADEIASCLNKEKLQELLEKLAFDKRYEKEGYLLPFGRYASPAQIRKLITQMRKWEDWGLYSATGRKNIIIGRGALMLSDTREAMMAIDKANALSYYASLRGTTETILRDTVLSEFGFDTNSKKRYDLGNNAAVISLENDLSLSVYDENAGKTVKSIPKKGSDEKLYDAAKADFSDLKKNIKRVISNRKSLLFSAFLSGTGFQPNEWKSIYLVNPVLNAIASLIIWQQNNVCFTCDRTGKTVLSNENVYTIDGHALITVAHPKEMHSSEIKNWQSYFIDHGLKQPFEQIWEPVYKENEISKDRYEGCTLPVYRFMGKKTHGIDVWGYNEYSEYFGVSLIDCELEVWTELRPFTHENAANAVYELGEFTIKHFSRYANHIVYLLDKWTIEDRIGKNDPTIGAVLDGLTVAQVCDFIALAAEKKSTDSLAVLMDYKNKNYDNFDPMTEFTLE